MMASMDDSDMEPLLEIIAGHDINASNDDDGTPYQFRVNGVTIIYEDLKDEYTKIHRKISANIRTSRQSTKASWMRVKDGHVKIAIEVTNGNLLGGTFIAKVVVQRERTAYEEARQMTGGNEKYVAGEVSINYECEMESNSKWILNLDLDTVYSAQEDGCVKEVYALCPSNIDVTNKFQLITELFVRNIDDYGNEVDRLLAKKGSKPFLLRTEPRRSRMSPIPESPASSQGTLSPRDLRLSSPEEENGYPNGMFNQLHASSANIGTLRANKIQTQNRDIGYHIPLKDLSQKGTFEEGDVVGFFENDNQKAAIERINKENYDRARLAGVITRSYFLEGLRPEAERGASDLVCVIGIVKVRVLGMVRSGDLLYAYKKMPGVAATSSRLRLDSKEETGKPFLVGQALESKTDVEHDDVTLVPGFVSVVNGIDSLAMHQRVEHLNAYFSGLIENLVYDAAKKIKRRFFWLKLLLIAVLITIGIALWQRYAPNTLLRASLCKRGNFEERAMTLSFNTSWQEIKFTALEFKYNTLKQKLHKSNVLQRRSGEGMRYFINFERCKNRGASYGNEFVDDTPTVSGPEILSSDMKCSPHSVKYFNNDRWMSLMTSKRSIKIIDCHTHL